VAGRALWNRKNMKEPKTPASTAPTATKSADSAAAADPRNCSGKISAACDDAKQRVMMGA